MTGRSYKPSPALVVACIALFVALSGFGYAAIKLPKNSVGTKQLRNRAVTAKKLAKNAVTPAKIAPDVVTGDKIVNDSVTGADVVESSLGRVPSAANASTVGGLAPATFARASHFYTGRADPTALTATPIITIPNAFRVETDGQPNNLFEFRIVNLTGDQWDFTTEQNAGTTSTLPNGFVFISSYGNNVVTYFGRDVAHLDRYVMLTCGHVAANPPNQIECFAEVSPALG